MHSQDDSKPLIVTALLDDAAFSFFDDMRRTHFPAARNQVPAHLTLFHNLPGAELPAVTATIIKLCEARTGPMTASVTGIKFLGKGCAYIIDCPALARLHEELKQIWRPWLIPQDLQPFRPHIVIQNKADPDEAKQLFTELSQSFQIFDFTITGLQLWRYLGGSWENERQFCF